MTLNNVFYRNTEAIRDKYSSGDGYFDISDELTRMASDGDFKTEIRYPTPELAASWAGNFKEQVIDRTFYIIGFSDGQFIQKLLDVTAPSNMIYVYEPSLASFVCVLNKYDLTGVLSSPRVVICVEGINGNNIFDIIVSTVTYSNYRLIMMGVLPGYEAYAEAYGRIKSMLEYRVEMVQFEKLTDIELAKMVRRNQLMNYPDVASQRSVNQLADRFAEIDKTGIPAIIVSAGPSLDKNINELKKAGKKAFIIVVDTALKAVLRAGIEPDITVCIDPRKETVFFGHEKFKYIPAVFGTDITAEVIKKHKGNRFYAGNGEGDIFDSFRIKYRGSAYMTLPAGGSVANTAYSLAVALGFKTIILVGQDLAFTDGKGHTKDAYDDEEKNKRDAEENRYVCEVEAIGGGTVKTEARMRSYIQWFENSIKSMPDIRVIDATEGGALIHGTTVMTLQKAIEEECRGSCIDFRDIIEKIPPEFSEEEQRHIKSYLKNIDGELDRLKNILGKGMDSYGMLESGIRDKDRSRINKAMEEVSRINKIEKEEPLLALVKKYTIKDKYSVKDSLYESSADDTKAAIDGGIRLLSSFIRGIDEMKEETCLMTDQL